VLEGYYVAQASACGLFALQGLTTTGRSLCHINQRKLWNRIQEVP
jgi:hypothetical protein